MRMRIASTLVLTLALAACQTSVVTPDEKTVPEGAAAEAAFTGTSVAIDKSQSVISFTGKSSIVNHEGKFETFDATVTPDATTPSDFTKAKITATIDVASAVTDSEMLDGHLEKADFFDVAQYPEATFVSTSIVSKGGNAYDVTGNLTVKGQTKPVTIEAVVTDAYITGTFDMPRKDFGVGNDSYGNKLLDEQVPVSLKLVFAK
jgi:polyisoprenoid-binding protein YceI